MCKQGKHVQQSEEHRNPKCQKWTLKIYVSYTNQMKHFPNN